MHVCADRRCTCIYKLSASLGPFLLHKPPCLLGCLLLNYVHVNLSTWDRLTLSPEPAASTNILKSNLIRCSSSRRSHGFFSPKRFGAGERERLGFPACSSHQTQPPAASPPSSTAHTAPPRRAGRGQSAPLPPPGEAAPRAAAACAPSMGRGRRAAPAGP